VSNGEVQFSVKELLQDLYKKVNKMIEGQQEIKEALILKVDRHEVDELRDRVSSVEGKQVTQETVEQVKTKLKRYSIAVWALVVTIIGVLVETIRTFKR
jgi:hypothetical protein